MSNFRTNFPDKKYLKNLIGHLQQKIANSQDPLERLVTLSGVSMNWIADYIADENIVWKKENLIVDDLYLTGTSPEWNKIIIDRCKRSPIKLRFFIKKYSNIRKMFAKEKFDDFPILVRYEESNYKVLDGMHRVVGAIVQNKKIIKAFVARHKKRFSPVCEPHIIYDLLRAYYRGLNDDRDGLIIALKFLKNSYADVEDLLRNRFSKSFVPSDKMQEILKEVLKK